MLASPNGRFYLDSCCHNLKTRHARYGHKNIERYRYSNSVSPDRESGELAIKLSDLQRVTDSTSFVLLLLLFIEQKPLNEIQYNDKVLYGFLRNIQAHK